MKEEPMTPDEPAGPDADVLSERRHLVSLAFRMLGTVAEAEDAVQETYIRWYRLTPRSATSSRCRAPGRRAPRAACASTCWTRRAVGVNAAWARGSRNRCRPTRSRRHRPSPRTRPTVRPSTTPSARPCSWCSSR
ncbi:sigma factor [Luteimicrobium album]|uniref:sigma factor n=1 Tax=Luteimicrobium album TaxID=1054550 RepID=UPI0032AFEA33